MIGTTVGRYRVLSLLGQGGMGEVFLAEDETLGRKVVLKALPPALAADPDRRQRFEREARAVAALNHPNIVTIYGVERAGDALLLAMEFVDGQPLSRAIAEGGLPAPDLLRIATQLTDAVGAAHRQGIVHRDLKPDNVMVGPDGRVKVLDFGLSKHVEGRPGLGIGDAAGTGPTRTANATQLGVIVGTPHYMSPEQAQGLPIDHRTDIFSLGVVLYEMATGARPFEGPTSVGVISSILKDAPRPLGQLRPELPEAFAHLVERCLEKEPDRRFPDAAALRNDLDRIASAPKGPESQVPPSNLELPPLEHRPFRAGVSAGEPAHTRRRTVVAVAAVLLTVAVAAAAWWWLARPRAPQVALDPSRILVAPVVNRTGDASLDALGPIASAAVARTLATEGILVVPEEPGTGRRNDGADAVVARARRAGAAHALSGELVLAGNDLAFRGQLTDVATSAAKRVFEGITVPRSTPNAIVPMIQQRVAGATMFNLRGAGGMTGFSNEMLAHLEAPTYDAYREFQAGLENFGTNQPQAKQHFERTLELDPRLWWTLGWLVPIYESLGEFQKADDIVRKMRPGVPPTGKATLDYLAARLDGRLLDAYAAARAVHAAMPNHLPTATIAAWTARDLGRPQEMLNASLPITPDPRGNAAAWRGWVDTVSQAYHMLGRYDEERAVGERAVATVPGAALGLLVQARALAARGDVEGLGKVLEACLTVPPSARPRPGLVILTAAAELRAHGYRDASKPVATQALRWLDGLDATLASSAPMQSLRGDALALLGRWPEASAVTAKLAAMSPTSPWLRSDLGVIAAERGDTAGANKADAALTQMNRPYIRGAHTYGRARIAAALGERDRAVDLLREAFAEGQPLAWPTHDDYAFERLRGYEPFETLVKVIK